MHGTSVRPQRQKESLQVMRHRKGLFGSWIRSKVVPVMNETTSSGPIKVTYDAEGA